METTTTITGKLRRAVVELTPRKVLILYIPRYHYHYPGGHDSRLALLPPELLANARVLDVGCNEGWVSCEIGAPLISLPLAAC